MNYKVNKEKCIGCQVCVATCPEATKIDQDGKAEVTDSKKLGNAAGKAFARSARSKRLNNLFSHLIFTS